MFTDKRSHKFLVIILAVLFMAGSLSGCTTMRRKFVRQKKEKDNKETMIPVLEPEEYAPAIHSPIEKYRMQYVTWKAYFGDLWDTLGKGDGDKRERYILTQIAAKIDEMADLLKDNKKAEIKVFSAKALGMLKELDKTRAIRRYDVMKTELRTIESSLRRGFKPEVAEQFLK